MSARPVLAAALLALAACAAPAPADTPPRPHPALSAVACPRHPSAADVAAAKGAHQAATRLFERGDYDAAVRCWTDAYALDCTAHDLLLNIAAALEKKGDRAGSLAQIEAYLQHHPKTPLVEERARRLRRELAR